MLSSPNSLIKQAKANKPQAFQSWNKQLATSNEGMQSSMDDPSQRKSKEFQYNPNQKLMAIQKMADESTNNLKFIQLKIFSNII